MESSDEAATGEEMVSMELESKIGIDLRYLSIDKLPPLMESFL